MLTAITTAFSFISGLFGNSESKSNSIIYIVVALAILTAISFGGYKYWSATKQINELQVKLDSEIERSQTLAFNIITLKKANDQNDAFIKDLQGDIKVKERLVKDFRDKLNKNATKFEQFKKDILSKPESMNDNISEILKETLTEIQKDREARSK